MFGLLRPKQSNLGWLRDTPFLQTTIKKNHGYIHPSHQLRQGTPGGCEKWGVSKGITTGDINHSIYSEKPNPKSSMKRQFYLNCLEDLIFEIRFKFHRKCHQLCWFRFQVSPKKAARSRSRDDSSQSEVRDFRIQKICPR